MDIQSSLKKLPSVEKVLEDERISRRVTLLSRKGITAIVRESIDRHREALLNGSVDRIGERDIASAIADEVSAELDALSVTGVRRVINATGVVLHTNLGRAVLAAETCAAIAAAASGYVDLEIDLKSGKRTERGLRVARLLSLITGAGGAFVVNNNAAAVLLAVQTLAGAGAVAISRGELVEIGGSFRLPEILALAAARVIEVGTTNRTHRKDYEKAVRDGATLLLKVHTSNYRIVGYTNEVSLVELAEIGREHGVPVMYDQGSGVLYPLRTRGIEGEDSIETVLESGVDLVCFSTDKVLGGPQGGALVGRSDLIARMKENHLSRALRLDKLTLAGLERVLLDYWNGRFDEIPSLRMITESIESVRERAVRIAARLKESCARDIGVAVEESESSIGGGSFPINPLRTAVVQINLASDQAERFSAILRAGSPSVLTRVKGCSVIIDPRTIRTEEEGILIAKLAEGFGIFSGGSD
ncbi:MAG: L-seryl-tRNA(Sec) selenium transferase [Candidatus Krumholzibacteria bacterium]|nr:L-seryl-tRNA(Sec) selenium transferase [Candidatus Krumholzibacteria bacterium]